jgi:hypothetical protein
MPWSRSCAQPPKSRRRWNDLAGGGRAVDPERRLWLDQVVAACDAVLARDVPDADDWSMRAVLEDVSDLRARLVAEMAEAEAAG